MRISLVVMLCGLVGSSLSSQATGGKPAPKSAAAPRKATVPQKPVGLTVAKGDTMAPPPTILREAFTYQRGGRRDPYVSLMSTTDLRPTLSDLTLLGTLVDHSGGRSVATLHDAAQKQYRVTIGSILGRMRVTAIRPRAVIFTIEEFGASRQDSLVLRDSAKVRPPL